MTSTPGMMSTSRSATCFKGNSSLNVMKKGIAELMLVLLFCLSVSHAVNEGKEGSAFGIMFRYRHFNDKCSFKIKRNNDVISYNVNLTEKYISEVENRASVLVGKPHNNDIIVHLFLEPLRQSDKGLYDCVFECPDDIQPRNNELDDIQPRSFELDVMYPPGPAECGWVKTPATHYHFKLQCVAKTGHPPGEIVCTDFETEQTLCNSRPLVEVTQEEIEVTFLHISREQHVSCCSVSRVFPRSPSTCNDFQTISETLSPHLDEQDNRPSKQRRRHRGGGQSPP